MVVDLSFELAAWGLEQCFHYSTTSNACWSTYCSLSDLDLTSPSQRLLTTISPAFERRVTDFAWVWTYRWLSMPAFAIWAPEKCLLDTIASAYYKQYVTSIIVSAFRCRRTMPACPYANVGRLSLLIRCIALLLLLDRESNPNASDWTINIQATISRILGISTSSLDFPDTSSSRTAISNISSLRLNPAVYQCNSKQLTNLRHYRTRHLIKLSSHVLSAFNPRIETLK